MQALAAVGLEKRPAGVLVMPGLVGIARLQGGKNMNQARMLPAPPQNLSDPVLLAEVGLAEVIHRDAGVGGQTLGVVPHLIGQRLGELGIVEDADLVMMKDAGHSLGK